MASQISGTAIGNRAVSPRRIASQLKAAMSPKVARKKLGADLPTQHRMHTTNVQIQRLWESLKRDLCLLKAVARDALVAPGSRLSTLTRRDPSFVESSVTRASCAPAMASLFVMCSSTLLSFSLSVFAEPAAVATS